MRISSVAMPIAIVSLGVFINRMGGFFALFLTVIMAARGYRPHEISMALLVCTLTGIAAAGGSGWLAKQLGLRRALVTSSAVTAGSAYAAAVVDGFATTMVVTAVLSAGVQCYGPLAQTVVGISAPAEQRVRMFAWYRLAMNVGATIGPLLGVLLMSWSMTVLLLGNALAATLATLLLLALPADIADNSRPVAQARGTEHAQPGSVRTPTRAGAAFTATCLLLGMVSFTYGQQTGAFALAIHDAPVNHAVYGYLLALNAAVVVLCEVPITRYSSRWPTGNTLAAGAFGVCAGYALNLAGITLVLVVAGTLLWTLGEMLLAPVAAAYACEAAPPGLACRYQSRLALCQTGGRSLGPAVGVLLYGYDPRLPWLVCGVLLVITTVGLGRLIPRTLAARRSPPHSENRYAWSPCPATAVSAPPADSDDSTPAHTNASHLSASG